MIAAVSAGRCAGRGGRGGELAAPRTHRAGRPPGWPGASSTPRSATGSRTGRVDAPGQRAARRGRVLLAGVGVLLFVGQASVKGSTPRPSRSRSSRPHMLGGVALVLTPWWLRLVRELGDERAARRGSRSAPTSPRTCMTRCCRRSPSSVCGRTTRPRWPGWPRAGAGRRVALRRPSRAGHVGGGRAAGDRRRGRGLAVRAVWRPVAVESVSWGTASPTPTPRRCCRPRARRWSTPWCTVARPSRSTWRSGRAGRGVRAGPWRRVRPRRGGHRPVRGARVDHRAGAASRRYRERSSSPGRGTEVHLVVPSARPRNKEPRHE